MNIHLYNNNSEKNVLNKTLSNDTLLEGTLREESNISNPVITVYSDNFITHNYAYIPEYNRYYYIKEIMSIRNHVWKLYLVCDVLMSFKEHILNSYAVIDHTENNGITEYMDSEIWKATVKNITDIINFPSGLLDTGEYILITAGG